MPLASCRVIAGAETRISLCPLGTTRNPLSERSRARPMTTPSRSASTLASRRFVDIGANLLDGMYSGVYNGKQSHRGDLDSVLDRAWAIGIDRMIVTAGTLEEAKEALALCERDPRLFCTVGVHPTRCGAFESYKGGGAEAYLYELTKVARRGMALGKCVAIGECGLDYARLQFCDAETQRKYFAYQFRLAADTGLPMFLHLRDATADFLRILKENDHHFKAGVVHSFDGSMDDMKAILDNPKLSIGINGCSLKTEDNLKVVAAIPTDRIMLETDCPWCDCRPSHASAQYVRTRPPAVDKKKHQEGALVKGRNEPCNIVQVLEVVAGVKGLSDESDLDALCAQIHQNTRRVFFS